MFKFLKRLIVLAFVLFCVKILFTEYSLKEWLAMILLGGLGCLSYLAAGEEYVLSIIVMIFAAKALIPRARSFHKASTVPKAKYPG